MARTYYESQDKPTYVIREIREGRPAEAVRRGGALMAPSDRPHDPRITVIQQELFDEKKSKVAKYQRPGRRPPGLGRAAGVRVGRSDGLVGAGRARPVPAREALPAGARSRRPQRRVRRQRHLRHPHKIAHRRQRRHRRPVLPRRQGHRQPRHRHRQRRLRRPQHHPELQERRHRASTIAPTSASTARSSRPRRSASARDVLMAAYTYLVGGDHLYDRVDIPVLQQGRTAQRHRGRRRSVARRARRRHRRVDDRPGRNHRRRRGGGRRDPRVRHCRRHARQGGPRSPWRESRGQPDRAHAGSRRGATGARGSRPGRTDSLTMCGIAAIIERDPGRLAPESDLRDMVATLVHRGPDDEGRHHAARGGAGHAPAGHRRRGQRAAADRQRDRPTSTSSPTARSTISSSCGASSRPGATASARGSDIESLLHAYEEWGEGFLTRAARHVRGRRSGTADTQTLFAARDRAGEKPLFYAETSRGLVLASEVKALLTRPEVATRTRSRGGRPVPDLRVRGRAAHDRPGRSEAAAGAARCAIAPAS